MEPYYYHPQTRYTFFIKYGTIVSDVITLNGSFFAAVALANLFLGHRSVWSADTFPFYYQNLLLLNLAWLLMVLLFHAYSAHTLSTLPTIYRSTFRNYAGHFLFFNGVLFFSDQFHGYKQILLFFYLLLAVWLAVNRLVGTYFTLRLDRRFGMRERIAVIGRDNPMAQQLSAYFKAFRQDYELENLLVDDSLVIDAQGQLRVGLFGQHFQAAAVSGIREVYLPLKPEHFLQAEALTEVAEHHCVRLHLVPYVVPDQAIDYKLRYLDSVPVLSKPPEPMSEIHNRFKKRLFDLLFSTAVIVLVLSWLYPVLAILIKLQSKGPVLFTQQRSGRNNKPFWCYKFRSMQVNADSDQQQATPHDQRITPIGRFLRRTNLDELPQFINVFKGEMSVVGPRPHMLAHTAAYRELINKYMARHFVKPGITGWAQVNGYRGATHNPVLMERRVAHDRWYMQNWTAMLDIQIVFMTIINMFRGEENAY
ncbi:exopolysaccharide biosynthesis polyprenyl glycosylphosphotransferase [Parapedobacter koreensis]|uniref:Putative colanic acid biosysnthesis UDP-glucose lipid carrier transferase n=1 Tax=Parapedobacter koreensis TaxID=332977 RepID=A0A1H7NRA4_9SPHI|nr:exopolysaccharide biosynthesis polyprenyl glycosylphosphotransferase [Parapedobacter koreensis]SEL25854.1 putative colanic acid biosysnthesis UDP-glucose lipid carrier transferase [Parapedobacter koreensis]